MRASAHRQRTMRWTAEKLTAFLTEIGVIAGPASRLAWQRAGLL